MALKARTYDFRILLTSLKDSACPSPQILLERPFEGTLAQALKERERLSNIEAKPHQADLVMRYSDDSLAPGISKLAPLFKHS